MEKEVDVQLFITCRLCLDEPGSFQIVPSIKGQINYCFGLDIDPFDGLPQLICKKCKSILNEYYTLKNKFLEKQQELGKRKNQNNTHSLENPPVDADVVAHVSNFSASDVVRPVNTTKSVAGADITRQGSSKKRRASWKKAYKKYFVCTICDKEYLTEKLAKKHTTTHKKVMSKHEKVFKRYLTIGMNKIDKKKNNTGGLRNVVYSNYKIISDAPVNSIYYSFYLRKEYTGSCDNAPDEIESSSSEDQIITGKKRRTGRIVSTSSTQTVILEENSVHADNQNNPDEMETAAAECINIDDTSSECPPKNVLELEKTRTLPQRQQLKPKVADYKAVQTIVTMCHKNYIQKIQSAEADVSTKSPFSESSIKHKVLSLGRKVINKQGFSCTGLLRYMEHKDLDITWEPPSNEMKNKGSNFVRIMTKLKSREDSENGDASWKNMYSVNFCRKGENTCGSLRNEDVGAEQHLPSRGLILGDLLNDNTNAIDLNCNTKYKTETKSVFVTADNTAILAPASANGELEDGQVDDSNMCLPIITSTTSLSCPSEKEKQDVPIVEKPPPRIKVKPASELMTERALSNQETVHDVWAFNMNQCTLPRNLTNATVYPAPSSVPESQHNVATVTSQNDTQPVDANNREEKKNRNLEYVTLHCPDLPNTRTKSPFHYFKTVLLVHGLKLLDLNDELPQHFNCLIKFQLMLRQDTRKPIKVLFSLFCSKSTFCFTFKDANLKTFDPNQLPAFWQWELLKVYKGHVAVKIQQNAIKISKEVHEFTQHFLCLLKSIDLIIES